MTQKRWRGVLLYLVLLGTTGTAFAVRTLPTFTTDPPASSSTTSPTAGNSATGAAKTGPGSKASPPASTKASAAGPKMFTGSTVQTRYGPVQVTVTLQGTTITDVQALQTPDRDGRSKQIAQDSVPTLRQEVLASQSAQIDTVSGASYTSQGYARSVQSALDQAGSTAGLPLGG